MNQNPMPNLTPLQSALEAWRDAVKRRRTQERAVERMVTLLLDAYVGEDTYERVKLIADAEHALSGLDWRISAGADSEPVRGLFAALHQIEHPAKPHGLMARLAATEEKPADTRALVAEMRRQGIEIRHQGAPAWDHRGPVR